jgi:hypothetical protein
LHAGGHGVAALSIDGAKFFQAHKAPDYGTRGASSAGFTIVRIELFLDDPVSVHKRAVAAGASERNPVVEHEHQSIGLAPIKRLLQGTVADPFGHLWLTPLGLTKFLRRPALPAPTPRVSLRRKHSFVRRSQQLRRILSVLRKARHSGADSHLT